VRERGQYLSLGKITGRTENHYIAGVRAMTVLPDGMWFPFRPRLSMLNHKISPHQNILLSHCKYVELLRLDGPGAIKRLHRQQSNTPSPNKQEHSS
jgi:hypothetical protein